MKCWTAQYRYPGPYRLDISVKGNDTLGKHFAPTWEMLKEYKSGLASANIAEATYTQKYFALLTKRMQEDYTPFAKLLAMEYVVLVCFCGADLFCHRKLLAFFLQQLGGVYAGEIKDFSKWEKKTPVFLDQITEFKGEYNWLSNFYPSPFEFQGILYPTNEHFYQGWKGDANFRRMVADLATPGQAKRAGQKVALAWNWETVKVEVMRTGLECKFCIPELRTKLLATENAYLQEGNHWHDNFWGVCLCQKCLATKKAENTLGKLLMERRALIPFGK